MKKGKSKNGEQRYLCRGCGRTFGTGSERILGTSRLPKETWMAYAECFVLMLPLRECARRCRVCLKTAYTMRHRLIECLSAYSPSFRAGRGCGCELDETYFPESFKGNHAKGTFAMPRPSVSVNIIFTISTNAFSPIAPTRIRRIRQRGCAAFGA